MEEAALAERALADVELFDLVPATEALLEGTDTAMLDVRVLAGADADDVSDRMGDDDPPADDVAARADDGWACVCALVAVVVCRETCVSWEAIDAISSLDAMVDASRPSPACAPQLERKDRAVNTVRLSADFDMTML